VRTILLAMYMFIQKNGVRKLIASTCPVLEKMLQGYKDRTDLEAGKREESGRDGSILSFPVRHYERSGILRLTRVFKGKKGVYVVLDRLAGKASLSEIAKERHTAAVFLICYAVEHSRKEIRKDKDQSKRYHANKTG